MTEPAANQVTLPPVADLDALDAVREQLMTAIDAGPVTVSAENVERASTNALLLLASAAETAKRAGHPFTVTNVSEPLRNAANQLGLGARFDDFMEG